MRAVYPRLLLLSLLALLSCSSSPLPGKKGKTAASEPGRLTYCDFDIYTTSNVEGYNASVSETANPGKDAVNSSRRCAVTVTSGAAYGGVVFTLSRAMDFTLNAPVIKVKIFAPRAGVNVCCQIKRKASGDCDECPHLNVFHTTTTAGKWEDMTFDFSSQNPVSNWYQKVIFFFDAGGSSSGEAWYIDSLEGPDDDLSSISLFQRPFSHPYIEADPAYPWRGVCIAAGYVFSPDESKDGNWYYYVRGSSGGDTGNSEHQTIGLLTQEAKSFDPLGKWKDYKGNPVIDNGEYGSWDDWRILGPSPCVMPDGSIQMFYKGRAYGDTKNNLCGLAVSSDWYNFTKQGDGPIFEGNPACVIYHEGKYYYYQGCWLRIFTDPMKIGEVEKIRCLNAGDGPANFDRMCVYGNRVFRLKGVDKWIMTYYGSSSHYDFPDRAHAAVSDDLVHWTKVDNPKPLFTRGPHGAWDQGGIWLPMVFEFGDKCYMYYEAWGREGFVPDRDKDYFRPGLSQVGAAVCDKAEFIEWLGLSEKQ